MEEFPTEILERILSYLQLETLEVLFNVCTRWADIICRRHFQPFLASQEYNVVKNMEREGWSKATSDCSLIRTTYFKVRELERNWESVSPSVVTGSLGEYAAGDTSSRISCCLSYGDKVYLGRQDCSIEVFSISNMQRLHFLESEETDTDQVPGVLSRGCNMVLHGSTLAATNSQRTKVLLYALESDQLVGSISNRLSYIYGLALCDKLLVVLSGWCILSWRVDSARPEQVRGRFLGMFPDFQPTEEFQNWLEVHSAVSNNHWLVTRATRLRNTGGGSISFLHTRRIGPDGHLGPVQRPAETMFPESVVEVTDLILNQDDLLAALVVEKCKEVGDATLPLRHSVQITCLSSGALIASLSSENLFSSVHVPICWLEHWLYLKVVPTPFPDELDVLDDGESDDLTVSLERWNLKSGLKERNVNIKITSGNDQLILQQSRLIVISTKFSNRAEVEASYYFDDDIEEEIPPKFSSKVAILNFWKSNTSVNL